MISRIEAIVGKDGYSVDSAELYTYGFDASIFHRTPDMVVQPRTVEQVSEIMKVANAERIPVVPRGAGTGLCGSAVPIKGGIVMDMSRMNKILNISVGDLWVDVQAGCVYNALNDAIGKLGFFFPCSPGSAEAATIGGMVSANASGMKAVKYGATRDFVLGLTFVKADGEIVRAGTHTIKDSSGYQLARLLCGSEGTLGVITDVTLKLATKPKTSASALVSFKTIYDAGRFVSAVMAKPLIPASCELMDKVSIDAVNKALNNPLPNCEALCIIEVDGEPEQVERDLKTVAEIAETIVREMEAIVVGLDETLDEDVISQGPQFIEYMAGELHRRGIPVVLPAGGLGCHINATAFLDHLPQEQYPAGALAAALYIAGGVRGMERGTLSEQRNEDGSERFAELELLRLAMPRRVYTLSQVEYAIDRVQWLYENRRLVGGLKFIEEPSVLRFFFGRLAPVGDWQEKLVAKFRADFGDSL